jgi:50S ribosomal subunit-associated GTPase HflX
VPLIIAGNKADILDDRCVEESMIEELQESYNTTVHLTSANTGENVDEVFNSIINTVVKKKMLLAEE